MNSMNILLLLLYLTGTSVQRLIFHDENKTSSHEISCLNIALKEYFRDHSHIFLFSTKPINPWNNLLKFPLFSFTNWDLLQNVLPESRGALIMILEGSKDQDMSHLKRLKDVIMVRPVLIICINDSVCSSKKYLHKITKSLITTKLHYVALNDEGKIAVYEWTMMRKKNCATAQLVYRGLCSNKRIIKEMFEKMSVNFYQCPLRLVTWNCPPYSEACPSQSSGQLCGIEGQLLRIVSEKFNATPVVLTADTPEDVRLFVGNRYGDLGFGKLDDRAFEGTSYSKPYIFVIGTIVASHSVLVYKKSMSQIFLPFELEVWAGIGAVIVVVCLVRLIFPSFRVIDGIYLFGTALGVPLPKVPSGRMSIRIYFSSVLLFSYICGQSYLANRMKVLSAPLRDRIRTFDELEDSNIIVRGSDDAKRRFVDEFPRIYSEFEVDEHTEYYVKLTRVLSGHSNDVLYIEDSAENIATWKNVEDLDDPISWYPVSLIAPNSSNILKATNAILSSIHESGILIKYNSIPSKFILAATFDKTRLSTTADVLTMEELPGVFLLFAIGLTISLLVFLLELTSAYVQRKIGIGPNMSKVGRASSGQRRARGILLTNQTSRTLTYR